ncbi:hypothetical protein FGSG_10594 [Fusarium graminearum PH-1]|uniref:hypothetical protein n=1 Tax=Gibberella zeae (strain ATCC MYA-4620 / CBS 123657 / FGSC 9075 / NRRL 31084 / PH-1) TaxID=229533 RepID=UPI000023CF53|nr:hypothetical protein FGSG_10594 [Fusarium graminearum PH-1]ESU17334.1 hypothetical protein FGSG_10594 [Fusarium graminearum PH-1]|eukprot:XP_011319596.1 hypothetical protein FGSG_10594 [Fusarium graminearum PH-1]
MRCILFVLGVAADLVVASSCNPYQSTSEAVTITSALTTEATSFILADFSTALSETTTTIELTTTTTAAEDTITPTETSAATTLEAATTSKAPAGEPTYVLSAFGGSLNGAQPQGNGGSGTFIAFDPTALSGSTPRKFTIDSIGRLQDAETQAYVCAYYYPPSLAIGPPFVVYCSPGPVGERQA